MTSPRDARRVLLILASLASGWSASACGAPAPAAGGIIAPNATPAPPALEARRVPDDPEPPAVAIPAVAMPPMLELTLESGMRLSVAALPGELAALRVTIERDPTSEPRAGATQEALQRLFATMDIDVEIEVYPDASIVRARLLGRDLEATLAALGEGLVRAKKSDASLRAQLVAPKLHLALVSREDPQRVADWVTAAFRGTNATATASSTTTTTATAPSTTTASSNVFFVLRPGPATRATVDAMRSMTLDRDAPTIAALLVASPWIADTASWRRRFGVPTPEIVPTVRTWLAEETQLQQRDLGARKRAARAALEAALVDPRRLADWLAVARRSQPSFSLVDLFPALDAVDAAAAASAARSIAGAPAIVTIQGTPSEAQRSELEALGSVVEPAPVR